MNTKYKILIPENEKMLEQLMALTNSKHIYSEIDGVHILKSVVRTFLNNQQNNLDAD